MVTSENVSITLGWPSTRKLVTLTGGGNTVAASSLMNQLIEKGPQLRMMQLRVATEPIENVVQGFDVSNSSGKRKREEKSERIREVCVCV